MTVWLSQAILRVSDHNVGVLYACIISLKYFIQCILIFIFLSWLHPDVSPPSCTPNFIVFPLTLPLFLLYPSPFYESSVCWPIILECGTCPGMWLIYQVSLHWRKQAFLFPGAIKHQQQPRLGVCWKGLCVHLLSSMIDFCLLWPGAALVRVLTVCEIVHLPSCIWKKHCFLEVIHQLCLLQTGHHFCHWIHEVWGVSLY